MIRFAFVRLNECERRSVGRSVGRNEGEEAFEDWKMGLVGPERAKLLKGDLNTTGQGTRLFDGGKMKRAKLGNRSGAQMERV